MTPEHYIMNEIRLWCGNHNILCFRTNVGKVKLATGGYFDTGLPTGFPDLLILDNNGHTIYCEVKTQKGQQRTEQIEFQKNIESRGHIYIVARSISDIKKVLSEINHKDF